MANEVKFANTVITVQSEVVAKVTNFTKSVSVSEVDVTGAEDVVAGTNILYQQFVPIAVGETASVEGITVEDEVSGLDVGQSELKDAAESGEVVTIQHTRNTGYGTEYTGFFTSYEESGGVNGVYTFRGDFRVTSKSDIVPSS